MPTEGQQGLTSRPGDELPFGKIRVDEVGDKTYFHIDSANPDHPLEKQALIRVKNPVRVRR